MDLAATAKDGRRNLRRETTRNGQKDVPVSITTLGARACPVVSTDTGTLVPVGDLVHACHETTIDQALKRYQPTGLTRDGLLPVLAYCAEQRCVAEKATCPGCRMRIDSDGIETFDQFIAWHKTIVVGDGRVKLSGQGVEHLATPSLDHLAMSWKGEKLWYWARRVLRKLRHGVRSHEAPDRTDLVPGTTPTIILVEPQLADNIGMVARAMANFGLDQLRLVAPRDGWPNEKARIAASGATFVIDEAQPFPTFEASLGDLNWVCATTARQRDMAKPVLTPEQAIAEMIWRIGQGQKCGIVFGRERNGLESSEIANADAIVMAPVDPHFASLNLAQSVLLLAYEWIKQTGGGTLGRVTTFEQPLAAGMQTRGFQPASKEQLLGFFEHLESELDAQGFLYPPHKRPTMVQNLRSMFSRLGASEQEIRTLRGMVKALVHGRGLGRGQGGRVP
jgi:tRNA/rRNA methyltransferase